MFKDELFGEKSIRLIILILVAVLSFSVISPYVSKPANRTNAINTLDDQKLTAMGLTATVSSAAFLVSALPDDTGTSLADELDDLSSILMAIVCVIYMEKFLLTTTGMLSFSILIPLSCALLGINLYKPSKTLQSWAVKLLIFAFLLFVMVPTGVKLTNMVEETFHESIALSFNAVEQYSQEVEDNDDEDKGRLQQIISDIGDGVTRMIDTAKNLLSALTDAIAVLVITTCAIPILTVLIFVWGIKKLFGYEIEKHFGYEIKLPSVKQLPHLSSRFKHSKQPKLSE